MMTALKLPIETVTVTIEKPAENPLAPMQRALETHVYDDIDGAFQAAAGLFLHPRSPDSLRMHYRRTPKSIVELRLNKPAFA
jgi:hypothetical protein